MPSRIEGRVGEHRDPRKFQPVECRYGGIVSPSAPLVSVSAFILVMEQFILDIDFRLDRLIRADERAAAAADAISFHIGNLLHNLDYLGAADVGVGTGPSDWTTLWTFTAGTIAFTGQTAVHLPQRLQRSSRQRTI